MKLTHNCPYCQKPQITVSEEFCSSLNKYIVTSKCNHSYLVDKITIESDNYSSVSGKHSCYPFQIEGIKFAEKTNFNCCIADAMGLGKTIQSLVSLRNTPSLLPSVIIVKTNTVPQWMRETWEWFDYQPTAIFPIIGGKSIVPPNFPLYLISMDTLGRNETWKRVAKINPQSIIVDECHSFKDISAKRTIALVSLIKSANIQHKILLSGTPIKNRANEYFTTLNLIAPDKFPSLKSFQYRWLIPNERNQYTRINPWRLDEFKELISNFVIRREKEEVLVDLPDLSETYDWTTIDSEVLKQNYNNEIDIFGKELSSGHNDSLYILSELSKLRRLTAEAKLPYAADYVEDFLESNSNEKIAIGIHHHSVRDGLKLALRNRNISALTYSGEDTPWKKDDILSQFENEERNRVLIISELAGGFGLNLQFCANVLILERQWNFADEEQFISRFHRNGQIKAVSAKFLLCEETIDKYFDEMVKEKELIFKETICDWSITEDIGSLRELARKVVERKLL